MAVSIRYKDSMITILTVTLNAAIDKRYVVEEFQPGQVNRVKECVYVPGGKGINVSKPAVMAGAKVIATGFLGGHSGDYIEEALKPFGIDSRFYRVKGESRSCINIWDIKNKTQTEFLEPGFTVTEEDFINFLAHFRSIIPESDVVTMSGSIPMGLDKTVYQELIRVCKEAGKPVILDTSGKLLEAGVDAYPTVVKPNLDEIRMLTGLKCADIEEIAHAAQSLHQRGIPIVAVSLGSNGSVVACENGIFRAIVPEIDAVNTVGCGDAMTAGFAMGIAQKLPIEQILLQASAISVASAMHPQTGLYNPTDFENMLSLIQIQKIQ